MKFNVLGPVTIVGDDGRLVDLGRPKQRALVAALLVARNRVLPCDRLIDLLWPDGPPARAGASLRTYVSNVRRTLEPERGPREPPKVLLTRPPGYVLRVEPTDLDAAVFEMLAVQGSRLLAEGRTGPAFDRLAEALALWGGPPLADVVLPGPGRAEAVRLEELRVLAEEHRLEAALALGRNAEAVAELQSLVTIHPLREGLWRLLILGLYRSNRQANALQAFQSARATLVEVGLQPGPELRALEADILVHAPTLSRSGATGHVTQVTQAVEEPARTNPHTSCSKRHAKRVRPVEWSPRHALPRLP